MHALVDQLAAARQRGIRAPLAVVALAAAVAIARAEKHHRPEHAALEYFARLQERGVKTMVIAEPHPRTGLLGGLMHPAQLRGVEGAGLLDDDVLPRANRRERDRGERGVEG